jgi:hypothetical protein
MMKCEANEADQVGWFREARTSVRRWVRSRQLELNGAQD